MENNPKKPEIPVIFIFLSLLPPVHVMLIGWRVFSFLRDLSVINFSWIFAAIYLYPVLIYRLLQLIAKTHIGSAPVNDPKSWPWLAGIKLQMIFIAFPFFENLLILFPEVFSLWLRLWGSRIGKMVIWSNHTTIMDRTHLEVGDYCMIGHDVMMTSHLVDVRDGVSTLYYDPIKIGSQCFIGGKTSIGPGVVIADNARVPALSVLLPKQKVSK